MNKYLSEINESFTNQFFECIISDMLTFKDFIANNFFKSESSSSNFYGINGQILPTSAILNKFIDKNIFRNEYTQLIENYFLKCSKEEQKILKNFENQFNLRLSGKFRISSLDNLEILNSLKYFTTGPGTDVLLMDRPNWKLLQNYITSKYLSLLEKVKEENKFKDASANFSLFISKKLELIQRCFSQLTPINFKFKNNKEFFRKHITIFNNKNRRYALKLIDRIVSWKSFLSKINAEKIKEVEYRYITNKRQVNDALKKFDYLIVKVNLSKSLGSVKFFTWFYNSNSDLSDCDSYRIINCKTKCYEFSPVELVNKKFSVRDLEIQEIWGIKINE